MAAGGSLGCARRIPLLLVRQMSTSTSTPASVSRCERVLFKLRPTSASTLSQPLITTNLRRYHSGDSDDTAPPASSPVQVAILSAATRLVPSHGFTSMALSHGARDAGYLEVSVNLFPRGAFDLVHYYLVAQRLALKDFAGSAHGNRSQTKGVGANVRLLMLQRLRANKNIIHRWQEVS